MNKDYTRSSLQSGRRVVTRRPQRRKLLSSTSLCNRKWRRRESNPESDCRCALENKDFGETQNGVAADWQRFKRHHEASFGSDAMSGLGAVVAAWLQLPTPTQQMIVALVQATLK
jgi:hypothetical protein